MLVWSVLRELQSAFDESDKWIFLVPNCVLFSLSHLHKIYICLFVFCKVKLLNYRDSLTELWLKPNVKHMEVFAVVVFNQD